MVAHPHGAGAPGLAAPEQSTSDMARVASASRVGGNESRERDDLPSAPRSGQALRVIEGERKAAEYLARLHAHQADPDELALIVSMLYGATLRGFARVIEEALQGVRHE